MVLRKLKDEAEARAALASAAASGISGVAWSRANGVDARSLHGWRMTFQRRECAAARPGLRLVELVTPPTTSRSSYKIRVGELVVEIDEHFEPEVLRRLLRVVAAC